ncbi:MAG: HEPN domain-containing protein [Anaerolineae bacterium]
MKAPLDPTDPRTWLACARSNFRLAAEKALKALCVWRGLDFSKTHSLVFCAS